MKKVYVVTDPPSARGIYETWPECAAAVKDARGARFMGVASRRKAESILNGEGVKLPPAWAFRGQVLKRLDAFPTDIP